MSVTPNYVPREYKTINMSLIVKDAEKAFRFYNSAFRAELTMKLVDPSGKLVHAEMRIDDVIIFISEEMPEIGNLSPATTGSTGAVFQIYTGDAEGMFEAAILAGAEEVYPIKEQFYGDRTGRVKDPFGHHWIIATHVEDVPPKELYRRFNELYN